MHVRGKPVQKSPHRRVNNLPSGDRSPPQYRMITFLQLAGEKGKGTRTITQNTRRGGRDNRTRWCYDGEQSYAQIKKHCHSKTRVLFA